MVAQTRQAVVEIAQKRFPALTQLAEDVVATIDTSGQLLRLLVALGSAQDVEQAHQTLLDARQ
ncbi:MAG TPA: hypothetical protein VN207_09265 [Ktedonobacteraceae bacterium]|nr:hypothetical protein [Ktedonobacteraceae bacterium]